MVGRIGHVDRIGHGFEKALETAFGLTLLGELIEFLFGLDDLFARL